MGTYPSVRRIFLTEGYVPIVIKKKRMAEPSSF
jgi:hypothetical protein